MRLKAILKHLATWKRGCFYTLVRIQRVIAALNPRSVEFLTGINAGLESGFKDPTKLTRWTSGFLYAHLALVVVRLCISAVEKSGGSFELSSVTAVAFMALQLLAVCGPWVLVPVWTRRANHNARQMGACDMSFTPNWAAGWYFLPPGLLWKPYQVMQEIWQASVDSSDWKGQHGSPLVGWWWVLWLTVTWGGSLVFGMATLTLEPGDAQTVEDAVDLAARVLHVPLTLLLLTVIRKVHNLQMRHHRSDRQSLAGRP